jgi:hypothetical protein
MLQGAGQGMTHKQVCLLASLQVLGGEDLFLGPRSLERRHLKGGFTLEQKSSSAYSGSL